MKVVVHHKVYNFDSQKFSQKKLGSQVMIFGIRVPKIFNLQKFCPSLGRILTHLLGHFSHSSTWSFKFHFKDGLQYMLQAFQIVQELLKHPCGQRELNSQSWPKLTFVHGQSLLITTCIFKSAWFMLNYRSLNHSILNNLMQIH